MNSKIQIKIIIAEKLLKIKNDLSLCFAACKKHISLYIDANIIDKFRKDLNDFAIKKNAIYLPYNKSLPSKILEDIIKESFKEK